MLDICGFSGTAPNGDYVGKAFQLMNEMWKIVKAQGIKNKGRNVWVYEARHRVFAGVELDGEPGDLERRQVILPKYAYYKHVGPYGLIRQSGKAMRAELDQRGLVIGPPYVEIYGHWNSDETKLETELFMTLEN